MDATVIPNGAFPVLDKGYVRLVDVMGSDLTPVNAARVSFNKQSFELNDKDKGLINYLAKNEEDSPFRHAMLQFEVYAPLMVARQWWKYCVGSTHNDPMKAWNETSRRYVTEDPTFYIPKETEWRSAPENKKQGSAEPINSIEGMMLTEALMAYVDEGERLYNIALEKGVAPEQARLFLPAYGMYVRWYWTTSLSGALWFLHQRLEHKAQKEIHDFAVAVDYFVNEKFPVSRSAWRNDGHL